MRGKVVSRVSGIVIESILDESGKVGRQDGGAVASRLWTIVFDKRIFSKRDADRDDFLCQGVQMRFDKGITVRVVENMETPGRAECDYVGFSRIEVDKGRDRSIEDAEELLTSLNLFSAEGMFNYPFSLGRDLKKDRYQTSWDTRNPIIYGQWPSDWFRILLCCC